MIAGNEGFFYVLPRVGHGKACNVLKRFLKRKNLATGTTFKNSTRAPFLGTGTGLNRIFFSSHAFYSYLPITGAKLMNENESEQGPFQCTEPWHGHLV